MYLSFSVNALRKQLDSSCNVNCGCSKRVLQPVCSPDGVTNYFSPCFAGCSRSSLLNSTVINLVKTFASDRVVKPIMFEHENSFSSLPVFIIFLFNLTLKQDQWVDLQYLFTFDYILYRPYNLMTVGVIPLEGQSLKDTARMTVTTLPNTLHFFLWPSLSRRLLELETTWSGSDVLKSEISPLPWELQWQFLERSVRFHTHWSLEP